MLVLTVLVALVPSILCFAASAYMAFHDKATWKYFAGFAFAAGFGGIFLLDTIGVWRLAAHW